MGLLDMIGGAQGGSSSMSGAGKAMSVAMMGLLAYKALKGSGQSAPGTTGGTGGPGGLVGGLLGSGGQNLSQTLSSILPGNLGSMLGGTSSGSIVSGGLAKLVEDLQAGGHGDAVSSWIGNGPNQQIAPQHLESALGSDTIDAIAKQTGMTKDDLLNGLSKYLPGLVDRLTPNGRLPTEQEASRAAA